MNLALNFVTSYVKIGYHINVIRQIACMVVNPVTLKNFASLFGCTPAGRASDYDGSGLKNLGKINVKKIAFGNKEHTTD